MKRGLTKIHHEHLEFVFDHEEHKVFVRDHMYKIEYQLRLPGLPVTPFFLTKERYLDK